MLCLLAIETAIRADIEQTSVRSHLMTKNVARLGAQPRPDRERTPGMSRAHRCALLAGLIAVCGATQAVGQSACKPVFTVKEVRFSPMRQLQRIWTARLDVDASRCATSSGRFDINFIRLKETAPDLPFTEHFTWGAGEIEVSVDFWADEAVLAYSIGAIAPCPCRD
jgi:hypothetical protein